ncbi:RNA polymerase sigma factor [Corallococcus sp. H22C18031201]|uniref:sigma-70 family RNA polymerase sigma factor n=1 Tax=Citreicoccus inhibens TaxID=2849499 RepID=UPI000E7198BB|nr:sigma-70 family RNA polymerase sigma factor [Citreicoccus inhibens]MBU8898116.1 sigma-70 family RNA polymerase sigma factor [Citreicoccus inhibens]RJS18003.1 RNA polymerase sigma factor [Corallococcus sp. H22C18031201]
MDRREFRETKNGPAAPPVDRRRFEAFARARRPGLLRMAMRLCTGGGIDAEDLVQETLERAYRHFDQLEGEPVGAIAVWLSTTLSNRFLDHCRRRRTEALGQPALRVVQLAETSSEPTPHEQWERVSREDFERAIEALPEPQRTAYRLHASGLRYRAISRQLEGVPEGTVGRWLTEARQSLRLQLSADDGSTP